MKQIALRLPEQLHFNIKAIAEQQGRSMNAQIVYMLQGTPASISTPEPKPVVADAQPRDIPARTIESGPVSRVMAAREQEQTPVSLVAKGCPMQPPRGTICKSCGKVH